MVDIAAGALSLDSLTGVFSVSKALSALVIARLVDSGQLTLDARVSMYWPEFAASEKEAITVRQLLAHQAGLVAIDGVVALDLFLDCSVGGAALARQFPLWRPGTAFGYHGLTIGVLMEELVRRITGQYLQEIYERDIRSPRGVDAYLGLPPGLDARYVPTDDAILSSTQPGDTLRRPPLDGVTTSVFGNLDCGMTNATDSAFTNNVRTRRVGPAAFGGVASARGLAALYADALESSPTPVASANTLARMAQQHSWGTDRVLHATRAYGLVYMLPHPEMAFGSPYAFGHDGAGGALVFADPRSQISFAYIPHPMQFPGGVDARAIVLAQLAQQCAA